MVRFSIPAVNVRKHAWVYIFFLYSKDKCTKSAAASVVLGRSRDAGTYRIGLRNFSADTKAQKLLENLHLFVCFFALIV